MSKTPLYTVDVTTAPPEEFDYKCVWCGTITRVKVGVNWKCVCGLSYTWTAEELPCRYCDYIGRLMVTYIYGSKTHVCPKCSRGWGA